MQTRALGFNWRVQKEKNVPMLLLAPGKLRQEDGTFKATLGYRERSCLKKNNLERVNF